MSLNQNCEFVKADEFEKIWLRGEEVDALEYFKGFESPLKLLSDDDYIDYMLWLDINFDALYAKHKPHVNYSIGKNPIIVFHGGCLSCISQSINGFERCKGCKYFRGKSKENLFVEK